MLLLSFLLNNCFYSFLDSKMVDKTPFQASNIILGILLYWLHIFRQFSVIYKPLISDVIYFIFKSCEFCFTTSCIVHVHLHREATSITSQNGHFFCRCLCLHKCLYSLKKRKEYTTQQLLMPGQIYSNEAHALAVVMNCMASSLGRLNSCHCKRIRTPKGQDEHSHSLFCKYPDMYVQYSNIALPNCVEQ